MMKKITSDIIAAVSMISVIMFGAWIVVQVLS